MYETDPEPDDSNDELSDDEIQRICDIGYEGYKWSW